MDSLASAIFSATFSGSSLGISSRLAPRSCTKSGCDEFLRGVTYLPFAQAGCFGRPFDKIIIKNKHSLAPLPASGAVERMVGIDRVPVHPDIVTIAAQLDLPLRRVVARLAQRL